VNAKNEYLLLFRGKDWWSSLTPEDLQKTMDQVKGWFERLTESGALKAAQPLVREGAIVSGKTGRVVADGPFAESKEVIGCKATASTRPSLLPEAARRCDSEWKWKSGPWRRNVR